MTRTRWLQERRMEKFEDAPGRFGSRRLSAPDAAELLGMSERTFRRYRRRWEEDGLEGLTSLPQPGPALARSARLRYAMLHGSVVTGRGR